MARERHESAASVEELLQERRQEILSIAHRHGARNVRLFGSTARGESRSDSDVDLLIDTAEVTSPWFPAGLIEELESLLGRPVDIVTADALHWLLRRRILKEARPL